MKKPIIAVSGESLEKKRELDTTTYYQVMEKYVRPVVELMDAIPMILPPLGADLDIDALLERVDGVLLTGGVSNVEPHRYNGGESYPGCPHDPARDETTLRLIPKAVEKGIPLFGICRGYQEMNIAFGGSLHQEIYHIADYKLHAKRVNFDDSMNELYAEAHPLDIHPGGQFEAIIGTEQQQINSIHGQGIDRLGEGLFLEGSAPDGMPEAISVKDAQTFALAVQWHPEWKPRENPLYLALWQAFGKACSAYVINKGANR